MVLSFLSRFSDLMLREVDFEHPEKNMNSRA